MGKLLQCQYVDFGLYTYMMEVEVARSWAWNEPKVIVFYIAKQRPNSVNLNAQKTRADSAFASFIFFMLF